MTDTPHTVPAVSYRRILYATDLSEAGRRAFPHAAAIARWDDAGLTVLHVVESMAFERFLMGYIREDLWRELKTRDLEEAREMLLRRRRDNAAIHSEVRAQLKDSAGQGDEPYVAYDVKVAHGDPAEEILREVAAGGYGLVVMGNRGHGIMEDVLMGSTAWKVLHRSPVPVLLVPVPRE